MDFRASNVLRERLQFAGAHRAGFDMLAAFRRDIAEVGLRQLLLGKMFHTAVLAVRPSAGSNTRRSF